MNDILEEKKITVGFGIDFEIDCQINTEKLLEKWELEDSLKKADKFALVYGNVKKAFEEFMPELYIANLKLAKKGNPYKIKNGEVVTWSDYCKEIRVPRSTVNKWLAEYRLRLNIASSKKKNKPKAHKGKDFGDKNPILPEIDSISVTTDDEGNWVINSVCSMCQTEGSITLNNEEILPHILKNETLLKLILKSETVLSITSRRNDNV